MIVLVNGKPADYSDQYDDTGTSVSEDSDEKTTLDGNYPTGIFTKYPNDPYDTYKADGYELPTAELRNRRQTNFDDTDSSIDVSKQADKTEDVIRSERKTNEQPKVPLRSYISAIESDLVSKALKANSNLRRRRSTQQIVDDDEDNNSNDGKKGDSNRADDLVDVNKNFFEGLFNYTRPERETEDKNVKIPLNGLIEAVETTLVHSAQNLKESTHSKRDVSANESNKSNESQRTSHEATDEKETKKGAEIKVEKIAPSTNINLNLLSPITFKTVSVAPATTTELLEDEDVSTTEIPIQKTALIVLQASNALSLVPGVDNKLAHVQHQEISKTVFHSSLAIFPTIPPQSINAPLLHITTTEKPIDTTITPQTSSASTKTEQDVKHEQLLQKANKLKVKFAEIQAEPVILSQF